MNPKPQLPEEHRRSVRVPVCFTQSEVELLDKMVVSHNCRDRSDYIRKAVFGEIKIDKKKVD